MKTPFSPILLAGMLLRPLPKHLLNQLVKRIGKLLCDNHPAAIERLNPIAGTHFIIQPVDLPYAVELVVTDNGLDTRLCTDHTAPADVRISGKLLALIAMLNSEVDGDSLFFSREISVEGNTEALLTLRNALDSEDIHFRDELLAAFAPFSWPIDQITHRTESLFSRASEDMERIADAITAPVQLHNKALCSDIDGLHTDVSALRKTLSKQQKQLERLAKKSAEQTRLKSPTVTTGKHNTEASQ